MPSSLVFANKSNAMVDMDKAGKVRRKRDVFLWVAVADHCVIVIIQFFYRSRPWSGEWLVDMPDFDSRIVESGRGVPFPFPWGLLIEGAVWGSAES